MKIQIISDLHLEFGRIDPLYKKMCETEADILVLAGDISTNDYIVDHINQIQIDSGKTIIFVPGNHEYYHATKKRLDKELKTLENVNKKVHVLIEEDICIGGVCFLGTTGWWDGSNGTIGLSVKHGLNDFRLIYDLMDEGNLDGIVWGRKSRTYLSSRMTWLRKHMPDTKLCVITHHYPHIKSLDPTFEGSCLNVCFGNRWEGLIDDYKPDLWIHGHTHKGFDYMANDKTRIVCNPQGYPMKYAMSREKIKSYLDKYQIVATQEDMAIYLATENDSYDPTKVVEL